MQLNERIVEKAEIVENARLPKGVLARVWYPIMRFGVKNANKRKYTKEVAEAVLQDEAVKHKLTTRTLFGNQEHPELSQIKLDWKETSHVISEFKIDEAKETFYAAFDILSSEPGKFINGLLEAECLVGVSTRADGELEEALDEDGSKYHNVIPGSYKFQTVDFTGDPSTPNALPSKIIRTVRAQYEAKTMDRKIAVALLEYVNTPESRQLMESVLHEDHHVECKCTPTSEGTTITCECKVPHSHVQEATVPKVGLPVKVNEKSGIIAHIFPRTKKAIVQFADHKETVKLEECKLVEDLANTASSAMDQIAQKLFGKPYSQLSFTEKEQVVDQSNGSTPAPVVAPAAAPAEAPIVPSIEPVAPATPERGFYKDGKGELLFVDKVENGNVFIVRQDGKEETLPMQAFKSMGAVKNTEITNKSLVGNAVEAKEYFEMRSAIREASDPKKYNFPEQQEGEEKREKPEVVGEVEEARLQQYIEDNWESFNGNSAACISNTAATFKVSEAQVTAVFQKCLKEGKIPTKALVTVESLKENYIADAVSYGQKIADLQEGGRLLQEKLKEYIGIEDKLNEQVSLVESLSKQIESLKAAASENCSTIESQAQNINSLTEAVALLQKDNSESVTAFKGLNENLKVSKQTVESLTEEIKNLKETHKRDLIKIYVESRVSGLGLKLPKNTLALLEACNTVAEVNSLIRQTQDAIREGITHSVNISEIKIADSRVEPTNPMQQRIDAQIEKALKNFNV